MVHLDTLKLNFKKVDWDIVHQQQNRVIILVLDVKIEMMQLRKWVAHHKSLVVIGILDVGALAEIPKAPWIGTLSNRQGLTWSDPSAFTQSATVTLSLNCLVPCWGPWQRDFTWWNSINKVLSHQCCRCQLDYIAVKGDSQAAVKVWLKGVLQYSSQHCTCAKEIARPCHHLVHSLNGAGLQLQHVQQPTHDWYIRRGRANGHCRDEWLGHWNSAIECRSRVQFLAGD